MNTCDPSRIVEVGSNYLLLHIPASLDIQTAEVVEKAIEPSRLLECRNVIADMSQCKFVSSSGLRFLVVVAKKARAAGGDLLLADLHKSLRDLLLICGLGKAFPMHDSVAAAVQSLA